MSERKPSGPEPYEAEYFVHSKDTGRLDFDNGSIKTIPYLSGKTGEPIREMDDTKGTNFEDLVPVAEHMADVIHKASEDAYNAAYQLTYDRIVAEKSSGLMGLFRNKGKMQSEARVAAQAVANSAAKEARNNSEPQAEERGREIVVNLKEKIRVQQEIDRKTAEEVEVKRRSDFIKKQAEEEAIRRVDSERRQAEATLRRQEEDRLRKEKRDGTLKLYLDMRDKERVEKLTELINRIDEHFTQTKKAEITDFGQNGLVFRETRRIEYADQLDVACEIFKMLGPGDQASFLQQVHSTMDVTKARHIERAFTDQEYLNAVFVFGPEVAEAVADFQKFSTIIDEQLGVNIETNLKEIDHGLARSCFGIRHDDLTFIKQMKQASQELFTKAVKFLDWVPFKKKNDVNNPISRLVQDAVVKKLADLQNILQAVPRELAENDEARQQYIEIFKKLSALLPGVGHLPEDSSAFIEWVKFGQELFDYSADELLRGLGYKYYPLHLYDDGLDTPGAVLTMRTTQSVYPVNLNRLNLPHGTVIRMDIVVRKGFVEGSRTDGAFRFAENAEF